MGSKRDEMGLQKIKSVDTMGEKKKKKKKKKERKTQRTALTTSGTIDNETLLSMHLLHIPTQTQPH